MPKAFLFQTSTKSTSQKRKEFMNHLSLNAASQYIPLMLDAMQDLTANWKIGDEFEWIDEANNVTFNVFLTILFNVKRDRIARLTLDYEELDGSITKMPIQKFFYQTVRDYLSAWVHPRTYYAPFLNLWNMTNLFNRNQRNYTKLYNLLKSKYY